MSDSEAARRSRAARAVTVRGVDSAYDANAKLLPALIFVLEGLGQPERKAHSRRQARPRDRISDPPIIGVLNSYLHRVGRVARRERREALKNAEARRGWRRR